MAKGQRSDRLLDFNFVDHNLADILESLVLGISTELARKNLVRPKRTIKLSEIRGLNLSSIKKFLLAFYVLIIAGGCEKDDDCSINFFITGRVVDGSGTAVPDAEVRVNTTLGSESTRATTDLDGKFRFFLGSYSDAGATFIYFRKTGYQDFATGALGKGNGTCGDQEVVRDGTLQP